MFGAGEVGEGEGGKRRGEEDMAIKLNTYD
jgi:hypothetical protein